MSVVIILHIVRNVLRDMCCMLTLVLLLQLIHVLNNAQTVSIPMLRMSARNALIIVRHASTTIAAKFVTRALSKLMTLNSAIVGLVHLDIICKRQIVLDANRNALLVVQEQRVIHALLAILMPLEVNAILNVVMEAEMMMKNVTMETPTMKMVVRVVAPLKMTMYACLLIPQLWVPTFASATQSLFLPPGRSIGVPLKSSSDRKLSTILTMARSRLTPKSSVLKFCILLCSTTKT